MGPVLRLRHVLAISAALTTLAAADICSTLKTQGVNVDAPVEIKYETELLDYWSAACSDLRPKCILFPSSAEEVADIVRQLHGTDDLFAVKSGGHMPNNGFASVQDGVLISTKNLNQVEYDPDTQTAVIGPGLKWEEAEKGLKGTGRTVVGGRLGGVGVGGYMLGGKLYHIPESSYERWILILYIAGGLSFLSSQYGWAANNVVNFEVVLANGTIVNANAEENAGRKSPFCISFFGCVQSQLSKSRPFPFPEGRRQQLRNRNGIHSKNTPYGPQSTSSPCHT